MSLTGVMLANEDAKIARFREMEREHIARNQWYLGEKWGKPVSWYEASWHWEVTYRKAWLAELRASGEYPFD